MTTLQGNKHKVKKTLSGKIIYRPPSLRVVCVPDAPHLENETPDGFQTPSVPVASEEYGPLSTLVRPNTAVEIVEWLFPRPSPIDPPVRPQNMKQLYRPYPSLPVHCQFSQTLQKFNCFISRPLVIHDPTRPAAAKTSIL